MALGRAADPGNRVRRILLATDLGPESGLAETWAIDLARVHGAQLVIVSVIDPAELTSDTMAVPERALAATAPRWDQVRDVRRDAAQRLVERGRDAGVPATFMVWTGDPGASIVAAAAAEQADLVIVGSHGRGRLGRIVMGSVSDHVAHQAACPVLVVRGRDLPD
jgi:nucleotide-binding universal stress UspA family protein